MRFVSFLEMAGLLSRGPNSTGNSSLLRSSRTCLIVWLFTVRQFVLMFTTNKNDQLMLGDLTGYWNSYRMYYLLPLCLLSLQTALCCTFFRIYESELNWFVPFQSVKPMRCARITIDHTVHNVRINISIILGLCIAFGSTVFLGLETHRTAYEKLNEEDFFMFLPW